MKPVTYTLVGDYYLPNLVLPAEEQDYSFGKYGRMCERYLKQHRRVFYINYRTSNTLWKHLHEVDVQCTELVNTIMQQLAAQNGVDEKLKASDQMKWVGLMNNFKAQAEEIALAEIIYT